MRARAERIEAGDLLADARLLAVAWGLLLLLKIWLAWRLDLYSDEVFYWLASTMPAPAYGDLPFVTALLAGLGSAIDPGNPLATRALFLFLGSLLPWIVYWVSLPFVGRGDALGAALLSLCVPLGGMLGLLAVPDVPMLLCGLLSLGFLDRALRGGGNRCWLGAGVFMALGLCTHYRFLLFPAGAALYLLWRRRDLWRNPGFWLGAGIAALGLLPMLWANLPGNLDSASFHFIERHPWRFDPAGLLQVPTQILLVSPPLYALLLYSAWLMLTQNPNGTPTPENPNGTPTSAKPDGTPTSEETNGTPTSEETQWQTQWDTHPKPNGTPTPSDSQFGLLLCFALPHLLVYAALAPWADSGSTTAHWPLPGYFPLLVYAPEALRRFSRRLARHWRGSRARLAAHSIPALGFAGSLLALAGIGSQSWQAQLQPLLGSGVLSEKMAGWREFADFSGRLLQDEFVQVPAVVADNYYTAAQLEYAGIVQNAYTLDRNKAVRDGRRGQLERWRKTGEFVRQHGGIPLLFITEDSNLSVVDKHETIRRACELANSLEALGQFKLFDGDKQFSFYGGQVAADPNAPAAFPCPYPPRAWIDQPPPGARISGTVAIGGWAYNEDLGVERVLLLLDGAVIAELDYGLPRPDVVEAENLRSDPNRPNLGFQSNIDTAVFNNGRHELWIRIINSGGVETDYGRREVLLENP